MDDFRAFLKRYKWRVIAVCFGLVFAILIFSIGFWRTLLLLLIVAVCYFVGTLLDAGGRENLKNTIGVLFKK